MQHIDQGQVKRYQKRCQKWKVKLTGNAIRVPTPNVSMAVANLNLERKAQNKGRVERMARGNAPSSTLSTDFRLAILTPSEIVSTDLLVLATCAVDGVATIAQDNRAVLWHLVQINESATAVVHRMEQDDGSSLQDTHP
ncbi:hypothetical protein O9992_26030 [Vibrio lentus]|nr:hypothetical protein [Vibrio lentus]